MALNTILAAIPPLPKSPARSISGGRRRRPVKRSTTMPSLPSTPRLSKLLGDMNKFIDDNSTSATSFMNLSLTGSSNHSNHTRRSIGITSKASLRKTSPTEICVADLEEFVTKTLPEFVQDQELVQRLTYGVQNYLPHHNPCPDSLAEMEHYLTTIMETTPSLPAPVVAELHTFSGLLHLKRGYQTSASAIESFTRALWLQSHLLRLANGKEEEEQERLLDLALTEHRLGVAYGRNSQYLEAIDQMNHAIQSYERAQVSIREGCYVCAKEDLHEFTEAQQLKLVKNNRGRHSCFRNSQLRSCKGNAAGSEHNAKPAAAAPFRRTKSDQVTRGARRPRRIVEHEELTAVKDVPVEVDVEIASHDSFSYE